MSVRRLGCSTARSASVAVTEPFAVRAFGGTAMFALATAPQWAWLQVLPLEAAAAGCPDPSNGRPDVASVDAAFS